MQTAIPTSIDTFWNLTKDEAFKQLSSSEQGLSNAEANYRIKQYGYNTIKSKTHISSGLLFLLQFKSPVTILLILAAFLSMGLGDFTDAIIIIVIILVSSVLGFWQEKGAANAVSALLKMVQIKCSILREGKESEFPVEDAVPGDIITFYLPVT